MSTWAVPGYTESLELGSGASGRVVLAVHVETGVPVAVKYLSDSLRTQPGFVQGFRSEARLLGGLESPYVVGLYEYVESPDGAAIVMELVDGISLRTLLIRQGPLVPEAALTVLKGSLLGLADAHRVGVVHRDYKPENVLVGTDGSSRLVDFGIAVDSGGSAGIAGTPAYMAPEQWTGAPASPAADVYAATATFFECLTRRKPYQGEHFAELALRHRDAPIPVEQVPEAVRSLVARGLAKNPAERPTHAEEFVRELEVVAGAAYGPDWEERGRRALAALIALLPLLLPSARTSPASTTDFARTVLRQPSAEGRLRLWLPGRAGLVLSAVLVLLGVLLAYGVPLAPAASPREAAQALATTSAGPGADSVAESSETPTPSATPTAPTGPTAPESPTDPATSKSPTVPATPSTQSPRVDESNLVTTTPTTPDVDPPPPPPPAVELLEPELQRTGPTTATATVRFETDGPGPVTLTVKWFTSGEPGGQLTPDGPAQTFKLSGANTYTVPVDHAFQTNACYWTVQATTDPASPGGGRTAQVELKECVVR
ncbi:serine/threonine-protein kinase [Streptomyces gibsoniae]|uniref:non-specific serine/threonine protein kinase n=1 Tax=Streptomyces gibsoniae TaxID=3075529 RepID=A0ABU2U2K0_9ACTN|nr:protein kinase [Streptomyces sp. DSM 41699]MDT0467281.1 protein kinase [Streptomyces sp. DSM 41699]